jgi:hypothetical protein
VRLAGIEPTALKSSSYDYVGATGGKLKCNSASSEGGAISLLAPSMRLPFVDVSSNYTMPLVAAMIEGFQQLGQCRTTVLSVMH